MSKNIIEVLEDLRGVTRKSVEILLTEKDFDEVESLIVADTSGEPPSQLSLWNGKIVIYRWVDEVHVSIR